MSNCFENSPGHTQFFERSIYENTFIKKTWFNISARFEDTLNFPHCIGTIDGNHIRIECPKMTLTYYYIYKGFYSIVLLAICGINYCFTLLDLGRYGSNNDSGVPNQKLEK